MGIVLISLLLGGVLVYFYWLDSQPIEPETKRVIQYAGLAIFAVLFIIAATVGFNTCGAEPEV